ncbi:hypothetical protein DRN69_01715 [Candidatus Pacearchaeota archaeon]|nr:MAG: hypothetical protein DRN69_01715 [Candidatus Pacearchaeota archaeon]
MEKRGKKRIFILLIILILFGAIFGFMFFSKEKKTESFSVNTVLLRSVIKEGEVLSTNFELTNLEEKRNFQINISKNLESLIYLSEKNFNLNKEESKDIEVVFNSSNYTAGVYVGSLIIKSGSEEKIIPVVLEVQTKGAYFSISLDVAPKYKEARKGEEIITEINFFNLKDTENHDVNVSYEIINLKGARVLSEGRIMNIGSKSSLTKNTFLPQKIKPGYYVFAVTLRFENFVTTSSYLFSINGEKTFSAVLSNPNFLPLIIFILLFIILFVILYIIYERRKLFLELKKRHKKELKLYAKNIDNQKKKSLDKAKTEKEREKILREFKDAKDKIIREIKKQQILQQEKLKELSKEKNKKVIQDKLEEWKKEIYPRAIEAAEINQKLKAKLWALEKAYSEGYISKESYEKGKSRIKSANKKSKTKSL